MLIKSISHVKRDFPIFCDSKFARGTAQILCVVYITIEPSKHCLLFDWIFGLPGIFSRGCCTKWAAVFHQHFLSRGSRLILFLQFSGTLRKSECAFVFFTTYIALLLDFHRGLRVVYVVIVWFFHNCT